MHRSSQIQPSSSGATAASTIPGRAPILHDTWRRWAVCLSLEDQAHEDSPLSFHPQVGVPCCSSWLQTLPRRHPGWLSTGKKRNVTRGYGSVHSTKTIKSLLGNLCGQGARTRRPPEVPQNPKHSVPWWEAPTEPRTGAMEDTAVPITQLVEVERAPGNGNRPKNSKRGTKSDCKHHESPLGRHCSESGLQQKTES